MAESMEWLEKLPVMSYPVYLGKFEELINFMYNYNWWNYRKAVDDQLIITILYSLGYVTSTRYIEAEVTPIGEKYLERVDGFIAGRPRRGTGRVSSTATGLQATGIPISSISTTRTRSSLSSII